MSEAFLQMAGVFSQLELEMIRARVKSGVANARAKGKQIGRPHVTLDDNKTNYRILKKLGDYKKPPNKRDKEKRDKTYSEEIIAVVDADRVQTAANVSRIIKDHDPIKQLRHSDGTVYEYTRVTLVLCQVLRK